MRRLFLSLFIFLPVQLSAQLSLSARLAAMANTSATLSGLDAVAGNPAGIAAVRKTSGSLSAEKEWLSAPIQTNAFLVVPSAIAHVGLAGALYHAGDTYRELQVATAVGKQINSRFSAGLRLNYQHWSFLSQEESFSRLSADLGIQYEFRADWHWGLELINPFAFAQAGAGPAQQLKLGSSYAFSPQTLITLQAAYAVGGASDLALGLEYEVISWLLIRGGVSINPFIHYCGAGVVWKQLMLDAAVRVHPQLGLSPKMTLGYAF